MYLPHIYLYIRNSQPINNNTSHTPNSNSTRNQVDEEPLCGSATSKSLFIYLFIYLFTRWYNLYFIFEHFCHAWRSIDLGSEASSVENFLACVTSVSVRFRSKERPKKGIFFGFGQAKMEREPKNERVGMGRGRKETLRDKPLDFENPARQ